MHIKVRGKPAEDEKKKKERAKKKKTAMKKKGACAFLSGVYIFLFCEIESLFCPVQFSLVQFSSWANKLREEEEKRKNRNLSNILPDHVRKEQCNRLSTCIFAAWWFEERTNLAGGA